jgi:O-antigen/teichoic acid export membrane protein
LSVSRPQLRRLAGRASWNVADQIVSSGTNLVLSLLIARSLTADGFGAFAVAFTIYSFLIGASRALIAQPLVVRYTLAGAEGFHRASRAAAGAATVLGMASGVMAVCAALGVGGLVGPSLATIGVLLPGLLLQDMWRTVFVAEGRPAAALANDVIWAVVQFAAVGLFLWLGQENAPAMIAGWGGAALVAAIVGGFQFKGHPEIVASFAWLKRQKDLLGYYAASFLSVMGANQLTLLLIAGLGDPSDVGALRAAQVVLGPLNLLGYSLSTFALPEIARRQMGGRVAIKVAVGLSGLMVLAGVLWGGLLILLPERVGVALLGDSWSTAQDVLLPTLLGVVAVGFGLGANMLLTARGFAKEVFWTTSLLAPGFLVFGLLGLHLNGAPGAALGLSLAQCVIAPVVWWRVLVKMRDER